MSLAARRKLERGPVVPQIEELLRERLRAGDWGPGDKLPSESALAAELGVGRSSVREAVRLLGRDGLVQVRHGSGTFVTGGTGSTSETVAQLLRRARLLEVYEVRRALEVEAARLAAYRAPAEDLGDLRALLAERKALAHDPARFVATDMRFHEAVVRLSGNSVLQELFAFARPIIAAALLDRISHDGPLIDTDRAHDDLVTALGAHDEDAAVAATVANLEGTMRDLRAEEIGPGR